MRYIGNFILFNGNIESALCRQDLGLGLDGEIYEVFRVQSRKPLFLSDHLARWTSSMMREGLSLPVWTSRFPDLISQLVDSNPTISDCDMRITVSPDGSIRCGFIETVYPSFAMYKDGVKVQLLSAVRQDPEVKIFHAQMRADAQELQSSSSSYESLLVNPDGLITEGSRSNVFFVQNDGVVVTAPNQSVLSGVVRGKILNICNEAGVEVLFRCVAPSELDSFDAAFLSSTPMRILPIASVGSVCFNVNNVVLRDVMNRMEALVALQ